MERLRAQRPSGLNRDGLKKWGMLFVLLGVFGRAVLQNRFLGMNEINADQLLAVMETVPEAMLLATFAIVMQFVETCAAPIFCFLLAEGFAHTSNVQKYITRVFLLAAVSEIPYNLALGTGFLDLSTRNPVFGLFVAQVVMYLYCSYPGLSLKNVFVKVLVFVAAVFWCSMLKIENGTCILLLTLTFWAFRNKPNFRNLAGGAAAMLCSLFSLFFMAAPMGMLVIHFYNGEAGKGSRKWNYAFYPALLLAFAILGAIFF